MGRCAVTAIALATVACSFDPGGTNGRGIDSGAIDGGPGTIDAAPGMIDAAPTGSLDAGPFVCDDHGLTCPGNQPVNVLDCGPPGDCWIGCRDGPLISFADAAMFCASWGGRLGWINSAAEEVCLRQTINGAIILGLTQAAGQSATDSGWSWNGDGLAPVYIDWGTGQPDDANTVEDGTEQCAYSNSSSEWHDTECDVPASARFTCRTASVLSSRASGAAASSDGEID